MACPPELMMQLGVQAHYGDPKDFGDLLAAQTTLWRKVIRQARVTPVD